MRRLKAEIDRLKLQNRETARYACLLADVMSAALTPQVLEDAQTAVRLNLLFVERRLETLETRRQPRSRTIARRFKDTNYFRECRDSHLELLAEREKRLEWQRSILRQIGDWVPMTPRLVTALRLHFVRFRFASYDGQPTPWVFHHEISRARHIAGSRIRSLHRSFASAARRAKLPEGLHQHDLRHRRVTTWLAEGGDVTKVKEAVGHSDIRTTMRYTHLTKEHLRSLVQSPRAAKPKAG